MRKMVFVAAVTAGVVGVSLAAFAAGMKMHDALGPVHEMKMKNEMMHMQVIKNKAGEVFVVIPMAEAEKMFGKVTFDPFLLNSAQGQ